MQPGSVEVLLRRNADDKIPTDGNHLPYIVLGLGIPEGERNNGVVMDILAVRRLPCATFRGRRLDTCFLGAAVRKCRLSLSKPRDGGDTGNAVAASMACRVLCW